MGGHGWFITERYRGPDDIVLGTNIRLNGLYEHTIPIKQRGTNNPPPCAVGQKQIFQTIINKH